jgi:N6-adenosine-specific RNA methylase IME4
MLPEALDVMKAWGFAYKTHAVWFKERAGNARGIGYWLTGEHELLLIGTRGKVPAPAPGDNWRSVLKAPVGEHSAKPAIAYELIEAYFPTLPKIELNARSGRQGWEAWGNEAPTAEAPADVTEAA